MGATARLSWLVFRGIQENIEKKIEKWHQEHPILDPEPVSSSPTATERKIDGTDENYVQAR